MIKIDEKAKRAFLITMMISGGLILVSVVFFAIMYNNNPSGNPSVAKMPDMASRQEINKSEGASNPTDSYAKMSIETDRNGAASASASGGAYVPKFAPPAEEITAKPQSQPAAAEPLANYYTSPTVSAAADASVEKKLSDRQKRLEAMASSLMSEGYTPVKAGESWHKNEQKQPGAAPSAAGATPAQDGPKRMLVGAGDRAYVSVDTAINTDEPSPVVAKILTGNARGYGMFGQSKHNPNNTISIEFTRLTLPSGASVPVLAFAVDPQTGRTSVQGSVNHKIFERFVLPAVSAGFSKYGEIISKQGTQTTAAPLAGTSTTTQSMTRQQTRDAAIGAGIGEISSTFSADAKAAKPAVSTERNLGIEVIFMQEVMVGDGK